MLNMHLNTLSPPEVEGSPLIGALRIFVPKSPFASKQNILTKNIVKFSQNSVAALALVLQTPGTGPQLGRMLGVAGGGCSRRRASL